MKTLQAFWHWVDNEKPKEVSWKHLVPLTVVADRALHMALELVDERRWAKDADGYKLEDVLGEQSAAIRDLSIEFCRAIEKMHDLVQPSEAMDVLREMYPEPAPPAIAPIVPQCPACCSKPCNGTHAGCSLKGYLAAHPETQPWFRREHGTAQSIYDQQRAMNDQMFKREYIGEWHRSFDLSSDAIEQSKRLTEQQLANMNAGAFRGVDSGRYQGRLADAKPVFPTVMNDDGLKALRPEPPKDIRVAVTWDPDTRTLGINPPITVTALERIRGHEPRCIVLHGAPADYGPNALAYLPEVIAPMLDRAIINTPNDAMARWCKGKLWP